MINEDGNIEWTSNDVAGTCKQKIVEGQKEWKDSLYLRTVSE